MPHRFISIAERIAAFERAFPQWPAAWPRLVREQGRDVLYAIWMLGHDYRNKVRYYGAYPPGYLDRIMALFPDDHRVGADVLHVFSGSLPARAHYVRCDSHQPADLQCSVYDLGQTHAAGYRFTLVLADPPYSSADAAQYGTAMVDRRRATAALAQVTRVGGHLVWLDTVWPMHRKTEWVTVGRIAIVRSTNHRVRMATIFERCAG